MKSSESETFKYNYLLSNYMKTSCKARKWGNSLGITIPKEIVEQQHIKPDEELIVTIQKKQRNLFGIWKGQHDPEETRKWLEEEKRIERESERRMWRALGLEE